jgi:MFS family permease
MVEIEPIEPVSLKQRIRLASRVGAGVGLVSAIMIGVFSSSWLLPRSGAIESGDGFTTVVEVISGWVIVGSALVGIVAGLAIAAITRTLTAMADPGMRLVSSPTVTTVAGAVAGGIVGALLGSIAVGTGSPSEIDPTIQVVPVLAGLLWLIAGWVAGGWAIGALVQSVGVPAGVHDLESEESDVVRRRLVSGYAIPAVAAISIALFVLPLAFIFIQFPGYAPVLAVVVAVGILAFASLSASRPGMRISAGEFAAAAAGVGVVLLILVSVLLVQGGGHGEEEHEGEDVATEETGETAEGDAALSRWMG